ncbi:hypothetical protein IVB12_15210 [Bradyrhizobium sp. 179]|nr:hypothetical protein [Bradyrhizobium sp. 179]
METDQYQDFLVRQAPSFQVALAALADRTRHTPAASVVALAGQARQVVQAPTVKVLVLIPVERVVLGAPQARRLMASASSLRP